MDASRCCRSELKVSERLRRRNGICLIFSWNCYGKFPYYTYRFDFFKLKKKKPGKPGSNYRCFLIHYTFLNFSMLRNTIPVIMNRNIEEKRIMLMLSHPLIPWSFLNEKVSSSNSPIKRHIRPHFLSSFVFIFVFLMITVNFYIFTLKSQLRFLV